MQSSGFELDPDLDMGEIRLGYESSNIDCVVLNFADFLAEGLWMSSLISKGNLNSSTSFLILAGDRGALTA
ncbi:hypothetical protein LIER_07756 [Lithospermum erythrorhizon]|uniref:Uncharacterized protein n=1 Tax=Lithospermum erythrorhizon TaxID=34254 RepID=A0AAV3PDM9_LITER